jgi:hypothetical protein
MAAKSYSPPPAQAVTPVHAATSGSVYTLVPVPSLSPPPPLPEKKGSHAVDADYVDVGGPAGTAGDPALTPASVGESKVVALSDSRRSKAAAGMSLPPALQTVPINRRTFAYRVNSASQADCGVGGLIGACGIIAAGLSNSYSIASAFRVRGLKLWPPVGSGGTSSASVKWGVLGATGYVPDQNFFQALPDGITVTKMVKATPPRGSLASNWLSTGIPAGYTVFSIIAAVGTIVHMDIEYTHSGTISNLGITLTGSPTLGAMYWLSPDGVTSNKIRVIGLPTTT